MVTVNKRKNSKNLMDRNTRSRERQTMNTQSLIVVNGQRADSAANHYHGTVEQSIHRAIDAGYRVGRAVRLGTVPGNVIGYNISSFGRFSGASYPLLVETEYGIAKCSMREVSPA